MSIAKKLVKPISRNILVLLVMTIFTNSIFAAELSEYLDEGIPRLNNFEESGYLDLYYKASKDKSGVLVNGSTAVFVASNLAKSYPEEQSKIYEKTLVSMGLNKSKANSTAKSIVKTLSNKIVKKISFVGIIISVSNMALHHKPDTGGSSRISISDVRALSKAIISSTKDTSNDSHINVIDLKDIETSLYKDDAEN